MSHKFILLFFSLAVALSSCDTDSDTLLVSKTIDTTTPVPTLFNSSRSEEIVVDDGECVIGCILKCAQHHGVSVTREAIISYFGDKVVYDNSGTKYSASK